MTAIKRCLENIRAIDLLSKTQFEIQAISAVKYR